MTCDEDQTFSFSLCYRFVKRSTECIHTKYTAAAIIHSTCSTQRIVHVPCVTGIDPLAIQCRTISTSRQRYSAQHTPKNSVAPCGHLNRTWSRRGARWAVSRECAERLGGRGRIARAKELAGAGDQVLVMRRAEARGGIYQDRMGREMAVQDPKHLPVAGGERF